MVSSGIVKLGLTAVFDAQHGGVATGSSPVSWGLIDELFVNLTMPVQIPGVALAAPAAAQPPCVVEPERPAPQPDRLIRHGDTPFGKEIFDISETQAETVVEPDGVTDDF